jgi:site-specific DNA recombinase
MRAAIYIRKSREDKSKNACRLQAQKTELPKYAQAQGWSYTIYDEDYASASKENLQNLKERNRLEQDIRIGKIDVILVIEFSRLSRDDTMEDFASLLETCKKNNVLLATPGRVYNLAHPIEWMTLVLEAGVSSVEMKVLKIRMEQGRRAACLAGKWAGGKLPRPYVYDKKNRKILVDQTALKEIKRVWRLAETHSAKAISEKLGLPYSNVRRAISDDRLDFFQAVRSNPDTGEIITCEWEPVMTKDQAARIRVSRRTRSTNGKSTKPNSLLSGLSLLKCGYCGRTTKTWGGSNVRKDGTILYYYGCSSKDVKDKCEKSRSVAQLILDERVLTNVFNTVTSLEDLMSHWLTSQGNNGLADELKLLESEKLALQQKSERLIHLYMENIMSLDEIAKDKHKIIGALDTIQAEISELESRQLSPPDWDSLLLTREEFEYLDQVDQRRFLALILDQIRVYDSYAILTYKFPRTSNGDCTGRIHLPPAQRGPAKGRKPRIIGTARYQAMT